MHIYAAGVLVERTGGLETAKVDSVSIDRSGGGRIHFLRGESQGSLGAARVPEEAVDDCHPVVLLLRETLLSESLQFLIALRGRCGQDELPRGWAQRGWKLRRRAILSLFYCRERGVGGCTGPSEAETFRVNVLHQVVSDYFDIRFALDTLVHA